MSPLQSLISSPGTRKRIQRNDEVRPAVSDGPKDFHPSGVRGKAAAPNYCPAPFYFVQTAPNGDIRIPCWSSDPATLGDLMLKVLAAFPADVSVLIKTRVEDGSAEDPWRRFHGYCSKKAVEHVLIRFREFLLRDSTHQFLVRNTDSGEYFALDDYGVLWLYPNDRSIEGLLKSMGFEDKAQELIYERGCWKYTPGNSEQKRQELIDFLLLSDVESAESGDIPKERSH